MYILCVVSKSHRATLQRFIQILFFADKSQFHLRYVVDDVCAIFLKSHWNLISHEEKSLFFLLSSLTRGYFIKFKNVCSSNKNSQMFPSLTFLSFLCRFGRLAKKFSGLMISFYILDLRACSAWVIFSSLYTITQ